MSRRVLAGFGSSSLAISVVLLCGITLVAQDNSSPRPTVRKAVSFEVSAPLAELAKLPPRSQYSMHLDHQLVRGPRRSASPVLDAVEQRSAGGGSSYSVGVNVPAVGLNFSGFTATFNYPDANMAVGDTQIVQAANNSYAVFDKSGNPLTPAVPFTMFWSSGPCSTDTPEGHPIVQWDRMAHRWLFAENVVSAQPYSGTACIAVSQTADATGAYYLYQFSLGSGYPDLPKWGTWPTGFFQSNDNFGADGMTYMGAYECTYDRESMEQGIAAQQVCFALSMNDFALQPADFDSPTPAPAFEDEFLFSLWDNSDFALYSIHIDWSDPQGASITGNNGSQLYAVPAFTPACNGQGLGACVPQLGSDVLLDVLGDRLLYRLVYYDDPVLVNVTATPPFPAPAQHWLVLHDVTASGGNVGERWYEFKAKQKNVPVTSITLFQSATYAPDSTNYRWMGSIVRDKKSNILMGYSISSTSIYPSIAIAGRLLGDPIGTMEPEVPVISGSGAYSGVFDYNLNRWGDYTSMRLDPVDGCILWYTNEYYTATGTSNWSTQINSATFAGCE